jgi:hypothetical protein
MTSIAFTLPATSATLDGTKGVAANSSGLPPWVFYAIPGYVVALILCYLWAACVFAQCKDDHRRKQEVILMRQQRPGWELYP